MVNNIHITRILEKTSANEFAYEMDTFNNEAHVLTDCPGHCPTQNISSWWDSFLTGQNSDTQAYCKNNDRKYPIRVFAIQPES